MIMNLSNYVLFYTLKEKSHYVVFSDFESLKLYIDTLKSSCDNSDLRLNVFQGNDNTEDILRMIDMNISF